MADDDKFTAMLRRTQESWENGQAYWSEAAGRGGGPETVNTCRDNAKFCLTVAADWAALREAFVAMREACLAARLYGNQGETPDGLSVDTLLRAALRKAGG